MTKENLRKEYGGIVKQYSKCMGTHFYTDDYVKFLEKQLLIHSVVVPKGTYCDCYIKYPRGKGDCYRCGLPEKP